MCEDPFGITTAIFSDDQNGNDYSDHTNKSPDNSGGLRSQPTKKSQEEWDDAYI